MSAISKVLRLSEHEGRRSLMFWCPGCEFVHEVTISRRPDQPGPMWGYNGNPEKPTFTPSVLVRTIRGAGLTDADWEEYDRIVQGPDGTEAVLNHPKFKWVCHSFVTAGHIQFLGDCTHALAGQTVDLPERWEIGQ